MEMYDFNRYFNLILVVSRPFNAMPAIRNSLVDL